MDLSALQIDSTDGNSQYSEPQSIKFRKWLNGLIETLLNHLENPSQERLENSSLLLTSIQNCLAVHPQIFVHRDPNNVATEDSPEILEFQDISLAFSEWVIGCLLRTLSQSSCVNLHPECEKVIVSLFCVIKERDAISFIKNAPKLTEILIDLQNTTNLMYDGNDIEPVSFSLRHFNEETPSNIAMTLDQMPVEEQLQLSSIKVELDDVKTCELFQSKVTLIVGRLAGDLTLFIPEKSLKTWTILCLQFKTGPLFLKKSTVECMMAFLEFDGLPKSKQIINHILLSINSLIEFYCSGKADRLQSNNELGELLAPFMAIFMDSMLHCPFIFLTNTEILYDVIIGVVDTISEYKLFKVASSLRKGIIDLLCKVIQLLQNLNYSIPNFIQDQILNCLFPLLCTPDSECFTPLIVKALMLPSQEGDKEVSPAKTETLADSCTFPLTHFGFLNSNKEIKNGTCFYPKIELAYETLEKFLNIFDQSAQAESLQGIKVCIDIILSTALRHTSQNSESFQQTSFVQNLNGTWEICWISSLSVSRVIDCCKKHISSSQVSSNSFLCVASIIELMLQSQDFVNWTTQSLKVACAIVSSPWVVSEEENDYYDLNLDTGFLNNKAIFNNIFDKSTLHLCLRDLALMPSSIAPYWRINVLKLADQNPETKAIIIETLPTHFHISGINIENLTEEIVLSKVNLDEIVVQKAFASISGILCCFLSGSTNLGRDFSRGQSTFKIMLNCKICSSESKSETSKTTAFWLQNLFLKTLTHSDQKIRRVAVQSCPSFFNHFKMTPAFLMQYLNLVEDPNYEIRVIFSRAIKIMVMENNLKDWSNEMNEILFSHLKSATLKAQASQDSQLQETLLKTIGSLGQSSSDAFLLISLISIIEHLQFSNSLVLAAARSELQNLVRFKNTKLIDLIKMFKTSISQIITQVMLNLLVQGKDPFLFLDELKNICGFLDIKTFLNGFLQNILPSLITNGSPEAKSLIRTLSKKMETRRRDLISKYFTHIFASIVFHCSKSDFEKALVFIEKETDIQIGSLIQCNIQQLHNELLLHLSSHPDQVFDALVLLAAQDENFKKKIENKKDMGNYLQPKTLALLAFFDCYLSNSCIFLSEKKLALKSLIAIMNLLGPKHITVVRLKLMATLRIALRFTEKDFLKVCCEAWITFVKSIELPSLGPLLNQVLATLLPLLETEASNVSKIFYFLIVENKDSLYTFFHDLYFIPEMPELKEVNAVLREFIDKPCSQQVFSVMIKHSVKRINHDNLDVRLHALHKLKQLLRDNQTELHVHLLEREATDPAISELVSSILIGCCETDPRIRLLLAECLGEIGAIDPGRLELKESGTGKKSMGLYASIENEDFAFDIIEELVRSYLSADNSTTQDCASYALQELLKVYNCKSKSSPGTHFWNKLSTETQEILMPLFLSRYKLADTTAEDYPKPICGSNIGSTFKDWVSNWTGYILSMVKNTKASKVFLPCSKIIKHDTKVALFLLPQIIFYSIQDATVEELQEIVKEVITVLNLCNKDQKTTFGDLIHLSAQVVFTTLDHLNQLTNLKASPDSVPNLSTMSSIKKFLDRIPQDLLANASFHCQAYSRALMHLEKYIKANPKELQHQLGFLQRLYVALDEPDGVAGVSAVRKGEATLNDKILEHKVNGQLQDVFSCYEQAIKVENDDFSHHEGLLTCLIGLDQANTALNYATGLLETKPEWLCHINPHRVEAAWKLASWEKLSTFLETESSTEKWGISIGKLLYTASENDSKSFFQCLNAVRSDLAGPLSAAAMETGAYQRGYHYLARLQILTDLEKGVKVFLGLSEPNAITSPASNIFLNSGKLLEEWKTRRTVTQSSMRHLEPILNLQRVLLALACDKNPNLSNILNEEAGKFWILNAKLARKNGHFQRAYSCLLQASTLNYYGAFTEIAKLHWHKGEQQHAINVLKRGIQENKIKDQAYAKAKLLLTRYSEEAAVLESSSLLNMYRDLKSIQPKWEESYFHLAKYMDRLISTIDKPEKRCEAMNSVIQNFGVSLQFGWTHVYHSMPRLLAIWFELGTVMVDHQRNKKTTGGLNQNDIYVQTASKTIAELVDKLPPFIFFIAFPQLISRICHSHIEVSSQLKKIIANLLVHYPQQAMWLLTAVSKSSYKMRVERCQEVFNAAIKIKPDLAKFIQDSTKFADKLLELCNTKPMQSTKVTFSQHFKYLPKLLKERNMSSILLPLQSVMTVNLPTGQSNLAHHNPFPQKFIFICGFEDKVEVLSSLQKPKKITILGSDGKYYPMMLKPKDDLRKDSRLMEFNNLVNKYLKKDSESRRRQLHIRTYTVVPLNEECGLIEWVPNLDGLRPILNGIYKEKKLNISGLELKSLMPALKDSDEKKIQIFKTKFLPRCPPVFSQWFTSNFTDPTAWYMARLSYARTLAVMSMVGYVLGLGDRHGENILFDSNSGDTFHVDFNCLFNKGETFDWPERVPFRLTHNLIDALGPTGYEGVFRHSCEATMRVMRNQIDALMSMLKPFIHDPLVEWGRASRDSSGRNSDSGEITNEKAVTVVRDIELRLKGVLKSKNKPHGFPFSIEGQVNNLIQEATDETNLALMYIGWAAYM